MLYPNDIFAKGVHKIPEKTLQSYSDDEIKYMIDFLKRYIAYCKENISFGLPSSNDSLLTEHDKVLLDKITGQPNFRISLKGGGRINPTGAAYHSLSKSGRQACIINNSVVNETDLKGAGLQFIDILSGGKIFNAQKEGFDPYEIIAHNAQIQLPREQIKRAFKALLDTSKKNNHPIQKILSTEEDGTLIRRLEEYLNDTIKKSIAKLESESGLNINFLIYREESRFLYALLEVIMEQGVHCLPLNDSYIVPDGETTQIHGIIKNTSQKIFGRVLSFV